MKKQLLQKPTCNTHEKLILFTVQAYLESAINDGLTKEPMHKRIVGAIEAWKMMRRFSTDEAKTVQELGKDEYIENLKKQEISFVVYAMQLLKLWAEDEDYTKTTLNISKKRLRHGRAFFAVQMLRKKQEDPAKYQELREIIDASVLDAKNFYYYTKGRL